MSDNITPEEMNRRLTEVERSNERLYMIVMGGDVVGGKRVRGIAEIQERMVEDVYGDEKQPSHGLMQRVEKAEYKMKWVAGFAAGISFCGMLIWKGVEVMASLISGGHGK